MFKKKKKLYVNSIMGLLSICWGVTFRSRTPADFCGLCKAPQAAEVLVGSSELSFSYSCQ